MKRILISLAAVLSVLVIVGYPAGAWYVGKQMETVLEEKYRALHDVVPILTVSDRQFKGGIFSSEETLTLSLAAAPGANPLQLVVTSRIRHLPLPGIFVLEIAAIDSDIALAGGTQPDVAEWTGGQNLTSVHTVLNLNGSGNMTVTVPAFDTARLSSEQATLNFRFAKDWASYSMQGNIPRFAIIDKTRGSRFQVSGVQFNGEHKRILAGPPSLYSGQDHWVIEQVEASGFPTPFDPAFIRHMTADAVATASSDNEFVDITEKFHQDSIKAAGNDYGPAQLDLTFRHLHAKSVAGLSQARHVAGSNPELAMQYLETLFAHSPELMIDRLSFTRPEGEVVVSAQFKLNDAQPGDFSNPMALIGKAYASVDFNIPEKLLSEFGQGKFAAAMRLDKELERMLAEGYATRADGYIRTKFEFHDAMPWFNGKQYVKPSSPMR